MSRAVSCNVLRVWFCLWGALVKGFCRKSEDRRVFFAVFECLLLLILPQQYFPATSLIRFRVLRLLRPAVGRRAGKFTIAPNFLLFEFTFTPFALITRQLRKNLRFLAADRSSTRAFLLWGSRGALCCFFFFFFFILFRFFLFDVAFFLAR